MAGESLGHNEVLESLLSGGHPSRLGALSAVLLALGLSGSSSPTTSLAHVHSSAAIPDGDDATVDTSNATALPLTLHEVTDEHPASLAGIGRSTQEGVT